MPQPQPRQQLRLNDMQMLQRHIMLKQLQELRRHQQLQELGDGWQQNYLDPLSEMNKQAAGSQFLPLINGTPIHDASQMLMGGNMSLVQRGAPPAVQGFPNGLYSQAQSQDLHTMGVAPQQLEMSLYGTPIASSRTQCSHLQGLSHDSSNLLSKGSDNQTEKPTMQSSDFGNSFLSGNFNVPSDQLSMPDGAFLSKQLVHGKNLFGQVPIQGFSNGILPENFQQVNTLQRNASAQEFNGRQEQAGWPEQFPGKTPQSDSSQGLTTLDPLEQKILFNMDNNGWNASLGRNTDIGTGGFGNTLECADYLGSFPSIQSGSWSALMQSAVAEASSSDTGVQEEWSGLSFQNTELSTDNQPSNFVDGGKQQTGWVDNNVQSASSLSCKPQLLFNDSNMTSGFPGFQQSGNQFSIKQREVMHSDSSHESVQQSPKIAAKWLDCKYQLNQPIEVSQPFHTIQPLENSWPGQSFGHSVGGLELVKYGADNTVVDREDSQLNSFTTLPNSIKTKVDQESSQHVPGSSSHERGCFAQFKFVGDVSNSAVDLEKGRFPDIQRNSKASEEVPPSGNIGANISASSDRHNMLELLHKVDHAREQRTITHLSSTDSSPLVEVPEAETPEASMPKSYDQSSAAQHFGLRLAPPSQRLPNSNSFFSFRRSPQSENSIATSPTGPSYLRNQLEKPHLPAAPIATQSPKATLPGIASRLPHFNHVTSPGTSQPISINPFGQQFQQFPILEAMPVGQPSLTSGLSQQVGSSTGPPSVWTKTPPWATQELHDQNTYGRTVSQELGACSMNSPGFYHEEGHPGKQRSEQQNPSKILDEASHARGLFHEQESVAKHLSEANVISSGSLMARPHQQNFDSARHGDKQVPAVSAGDLEAFGRSLKPYNLHSNYSSLPQVRSLNNVETDPSKTVPEKNHGAGYNLHAQQVIDAPGHQMMYRHSPGARDPVNNGLNAASQLNSFPTRDVKMLSFSSEVGDDHSDSVKPSSLPLVQDTPQEMNSHGQSYSQSDSSNVGFNRTANSQISLQMAPSWFKHYGTLKNGQMLPMYDTRTAKNSAHQFPLGMPFENLHMNTSMVQVNVAGASLVSSVWPTTATTLAAGKLSHPCVVPPDVTDHNLSITRSKKRKIGTSELLPWHKEVTQSSKRLQTISTAELEWAQAANRLIEKVDHGMEIIEDAQPLLQSKKRIVLTTQLMQQVFRPAPAAILFADVTSNYDSMAYFAAKLALGDACNLISCSRSDSHISYNGYDTMSDKPETSERIGEQYYSKIVEDFTSRAKKLESDLSRFDKTPSIVDLRVEYQELEKFSVINRFAKFHSRGQPYAAETSSSSGTTPTVLKSFPQRYVTAFPMPRAVPEGAQCLSL